MSLKMNQYIYFKNVGFKTFQPYGMIDNEEMFETIIQLYRREGGQA